MLSSFLRVVATCRNFSPFPGLDSGAPMALCLTLLNHWSVASDYQWQAAISSMFLYLLTVKNFQSSVLKAIYVY